ncbi:MAG: hypothetical protein DI570_08610 [Phenylobacterium zucineum]|nr:MAG: hypothetical protein DI570_08610 [Phenylobacterium zucineum]
MKSLPLLLAATAALSLGGVAQATPREVARYLDQAGAGATAQLAAAGVTTAEGLRFKARVASDGRLTAPWVVTSTGSTETDQRALQALRRFRVSNPPNILIGADVIISVDQQPLQTAKAN